MQGLVYHLPAGLQALFAAIIQQESLNIQLNAPVAKVTENGFVSLHNGTELQFDAVIVTIRPPGAAAVLPAGPATLYKNSITQACDVWIFNASFVRLTGLRDAQLVDDHPFAAFVTVNSTLGPPTGYPSYIVCLYEKSPYIAAGAIVEANISQNSTTGMAKDVLNEYGFKVNSVVASRRIGYPSTSIPVPDTDKFGQMYLLGEALSGFGLTTATQYVPSRMSAWFGHV